MCAKFLKLLCFEARVKLDGDMYLVGTMVVSMRMGLEDEFNCHPCENRPLTRKKPVDVKTELNHLKIKLGGNVTMLNRR
jgi:hypothetical protein